MLVRLSENRSLEVDLEKKTGLDKLIKEVESYIDYYSGKIFLEGNDKQDIKQRLILELLKRLSFYDSKKGTIFAFMKVHFFNATTNWIIRDHKERSTAIDYYTTSKDRVKPLSLDAEYNGTDLYNCIGVDEFEDKVLFQKDVITILDSLKTPNERIAVVGVLKQKSVKQIAKEMNKSMPRVNGMLKKLSRRRIVREALGKVQ